MILSYGEYRPDVSDYQGQHSTVLTNVVPRGDGYGPFKDLVAFTGALNAACRGFFYARKNDGTIAVFAGTNTGLFMLDNSTGAWTDVSKQGTASLLLVDGTSFLLLTTGDRLDLTTGSGVATYPALPSKAQWQFVQFNNFVIAVQQNVPPQVYDLVSSSAFADLGGSPPQASYIAVVNRFLVLSGITSPNVYRVQWSGLNATTTWTSGVTQSDSQDLADGGIVRGVAGGEFGVIFQDASIRRMTFSPGSPYVFGIDRVSQDDGLFAPYSLVSAGDRVFFCSPQGFKMLVPGGYPTPIGKEKIDRTFFADVDTNNLHLMLGASDPRSTRVYWAYKSINGVDGQFDTILCYDWMLERWTKIVRSGEYITTMSRPGITLEGVDAAYGSNIDTLTISSLDDISNAAISELSAFDTDHKLGFFSGPALEATMDTPEQGGDQRLYVRGIRPVTDATTVYASVLYRETAQATSSTSVETLVNAVGVCPQRVSTRYARGKVRIPAGTTWTYSSGVEPDVVLEGAR